jgi:hypothetical protein
VDLGWDLHSQKGFRCVSTEFLLRRRTWDIRPKIASCSQEFLCRAGLVVVFATLAHQFQWHWLRFVTSEVVLRVSLALGMARQRASFDTISGQGTLFCFVTACTFVDVFLGSIPLLWRLDQSLLRNLVRLTAAAAALFCFNVSRLEVGQILYAHGTPWTLADDVLGGVAYFGVWLVIWHLRSWEVWHPCPPT